MAAIQSFAGVGLLYAIVFGYFAPTLVAFIRWTENRGVVLVANLFAGWTVVGWVVTLVMSVRGKTESSGVFPDANGDR